MTQVEPFDGGNKSEETSNAISLLELRSTQNKENHSNNDEPPLKQLDSDYQKSYGPPQSLLPEETIRPSTISSLDITEDCLLTELDGPFGKTKNKSKKSATPASNSGDFDANFFDQYVPTASPPSKQDQKSQQTLNDLIKSASSSKKDTTAFASSKLKFASAELDAKMQSDGEDDAVECDLSPEDFIQARSALPADISQPPAKPPIYKTRAAAIISQMKAMTEASFEQEQAEFVRVGVVLEKAIEKLRTCRELTKESQLETVENCKRAVALVESIFELSSAQVRV